MFPLKVRKVLKDADSIAFEYAPVEVVKFKGAWTEFIKDREVDYTELDTFVKQELEAILLAEITKGNTKVVELEIDTGLYLIYLTVQRDLNTLAECKTVFSSESLAPPADSTEVFGTSWINRLDLITSLTVRKRLGNQQVT